MVTFFNNNILDFFLRFSQEDYKYGFNGVPTPEVDTLIYSNYIPFTARMPV